MAFEIGQQDILVERDGRSIKIYKDSRKVIAINFISNLHGIEIYEKDQFFPAISITYDNKKGKFSDVNRIVREGDYQTIIIYDEMGRVQKTVKMDKPVPKAIDLINE